MSALYGARPTDEVQLAREAAPHVAQLRGALPTTQALQALTARYGIDIATMVFYRAVLASPEHGEFVQAVDAREVGGRLNSAGVTLVIVPALFYREHPEVGGGGEHIAEIASACGIDAHIAPTLSRGSVADNAAILKDLLAEIEGETLWLLSLSKGAAEVRWLFQRHSQSTNLDRVRVWLNVCGLPNGCQIVDHMLGDPVRRLKTRALCTVTGVDYEGLRELTSSYWRDAPRFDLPSGLQVVNVIGAPLLSHVQRHLLSRYKRLEHLGPNDGMVLLREALNPFGHVYPVWGADHFFRTPAVSPLLYRLFDYLLEAQACEDRAGGHSPSARSYMVRSAAP